MVGYITESAGGNFDPTPEGRHLMVCSRVVDLGTQDGGQYGPKRKIRIFWELPQERMTMLIDDVERDVPVLHSEQYAVSFHEKSNLGRALTAWRGKPFGPEDFSGPPNGFHLSKLIGVPMSGMIIHEEKESRIYANLQGQRPATREQMAEYRNKIEGQTVFFDLDEFKQEEFDKLSDRLKETIRKSPEYRALFPNEVHHSQNGQANNTPANGGGYDSPPSERGGGYGAGGSPNSGGLDDDIPFAAEWRV